MSAPVAERLPGERPLDGTAPLMLDDPATAWLVTRGTVQVLAAVVDADGQRVEQFVHRKLLDELTSE